MEGKKIRNKGKLIEKEQVYFLNDDAFASIPYVNDLMDLIRQAQAIRGSQKRGTPIWTKEQIISIYTNARKFGIFDKILERLNETYSYLESDEFKIDTQFLEQYYASLSDRRQIASAGLFLGNRLSKVPEQLIQRRIMKGDESGQRGDSRKRNWNITYIKRMGELYRDYKDQFSDDYFVENITIIPDKPVMGKFQIIKSDKEKYDKFLEWFNGQKERLGKNRNFYFALKDFYVYTKLKYCEDYFYNMKDENMVELIKMQERGEPGILVSDASQYDKEWNKNDNIGLLQIDIAGNSMPYIMHYNKESIFRLLKRDMSKGLDIPKANDKTTWGRFFSHTITDAQEEYIRKNALKILKNDDLMPRTRVLVQYLSESIRKRDEYNIQKPIWDENIRKNGGDEMEGENTKKRTIKKGMTRGESDARFIESHISDIEKMLGIKLDEAYIAKLGENKTTMKLESIYAEVQKELKAKKTKEKGSRLSNDEKKEIEERALKVFVFSKLTGNRYSSLVKKSLRENAVISLADNLDGKFEDLKEAITNKTKVEDLKSIISDKNKEVKNEKSEASITENKTIEEDDSKPKETVYKDMKSQDGEKNKTLDELIKKRYINQIERKKEEVKAKQAEVDMLWAQLQMKEAELKKLQLEQEGLEIDKAIAELENENR